MKKLIILLISLLTIFTSSCGASTASIADAPHAYVNAYIDDGVLVIERGVSETAVAAYYKGRTLCGAYLAEIVDGAYTFGISEGYTKIRVWFTDENETKDVHIIDRATVTSSPAPTSSAQPTAEPTRTASPAEEPTEDTAEEESDEGYGGFLESAKQAESAPAENAPAEDAPMEDVPMEDENVQTFTFSVECHNALSSDKLSDGLRGYLPSDGFIAPASVYELAEGMTVYDALIAAEEKCGFTAEYKSGYISGIGGLYEFDCGGMSGWMYMVNGEVIMAPINTYKIHDGDVVQMAYTCSMGSDLGQKVG